MASILIGGLTGTPSGESSTSELVVRSLRLPRACMAALAGAGLGISGASLQGVFRNPLVGPHVIGVSAGAAFGGAVAILLGASSALLLAGAFAAGLLALGLVLALGQGIGRSSLVVLVLAGTIVSGFFGALVALTQFVADPESRLPSIVFWLLGSFATARPAVIPLILLPVTLGGALLMALRWRINLLSLGDEEARALGVPVRLTRWLVLCAVAVIVAGQVAVSGSIGWVGLVVPHFARMALGPDHRTLLPASALIGAAYMLLVDTAARSLTSAEIPLGVLTALIGTPVFALLLRRSQARGWGDG